MFKCFVSSLLMFAVANAQTSSSSTSPETAPVAAPVASGKESPCATCWDQSVAQWNGKVCGCPSAPVQPTTPTPVTPTEELPKNPNCTAGNSEACNRTDGQWDFVSCYCTYPPAQWYDQDARDDYDAKSVQISENQLETWQNLKTVNRKVGITATTMLILSGQLHTSIIAELENEGHAEGSEEYNNFNGAMIGPQINWFLNILTWSLYQKGLPSQKVLMSLTKWNWLSSTIMMLQFISHIELDDSEESSQLQGQWMIINFIGSYYMWRQRGSFQQFVEWNNFNREEEGIIQFPEMREEDDEAKL